MVDLKISEAVERPITASKRPLANDRRKMVLHVADALTSFSCLGLFLGVLSGSQVSGSNLRYVVWISGMPSDQRCLASLTLSNLPLTGVTCIVSKTSRPLP